MKKISVAISGLMILLGVNLTLSLTVSGQTSNDPQEDTNTLLFMDYFRNHWDDIHDVVMRFHNDDPWLKGTVYMRMDWHNGMLHTASIDSNSTGNQAFGPALIGATRKWQIPGMAEEWSIVLPVRTEIYGSRQPEFNERGILTGTVTEPNGNPVPGAKLIMIPVESSIAIADTFYTNREGIFIRTLIVPGDWRLDCQKEGYKNIETDQISIEKGAHVKKKYFIYLL